MGEELLEPTKIYVKPVLKIASDFHLHGISHITGGGLVENIPRILPPGCKAIIHKGCWDIPPIFTFIQEKGEVSIAEMLRTFNNGIGMVLIVPHEEADDIMQMLHSMDFQSYAIGEIAKIKKGTERVTLI